MIVHFQRDNMELRHTTRSKWDNCLDSYAFLGHHVWTIWVYDGNKYQW